MRCPLYILAAMACSAALPARAQFRAKPMILYAPEAGANVLPYGYGASPGDPGLLVVYPDAASSSLRSHHDSIARLPSPVAQPASFGCVAAGRLAENASDALTDVAYCVLAGTGEMQVAFGDAPGVLQTFAIPLDSQSRISFAHLLPRDADVVVLPHGTGLSTEITGSVEAVDVQGGVAPSRAWDSGGRLHRYIVPEEVLTMRMGASARALGVDDLYLPGAGSVQIFENLTSPSGAALADVVLDSPVLVDAANAALPAGFDSDCQGAAPLDVDLDGVLDLVVSLSSFYRWGTIPAGHLLWIRGTGTLKDLATAPWADLGPALGLVDPVVVRPLRLGGEPAVAVWDRGLDQVLVIRSDRIHGSLAVWRGSAGGRHVRDIRLADVVGSSKPDLIVDGTEPVDGVDPAILVYPDDGDASPVIAWAPGSPGTPLRGEDHPMEVVASDPDGPFRVDWTIGDPWGATTAAGTATYVLPGYQLCGESGQEVEVTVRAIDGFGVYDEIGATLDVAFAPRLEIAGAVPPGRLVLSKGGAVAVIDGSAWTQCALVSLSWNSPWPTGAQAAIDSGQGWTRQTVTLPESTYEALLDGREIVVELTATDGTLGASAVATLPLEIDAGGLVELAHDSDLAAISEGEVAVLETRIESRLQVSLPSVHVIEALAGLVPAGAPQVSGANVAETLAGGAEVVLDSLPPEGTEVVIRLPVRLAGGRAASAAEVRSSGGHLLTAPASVAAEGAPVPGCGCGTSPAGGALALAALIALRRRSRAAPVT